MSLAVRIARCGAVGGCVALAVTGVLAADVAHPFERAVLVPDAGPVRIALDGRALGIGADARRLTVFDPDGARVPHRLLLPHGPVVAARTVRVEETADRFVVVFDLGPVPTRHDRLQVELARRVTAPDCRLEGSDDALRWTALAVGSVFRIGDADGLERSALDYDADGSRYLRLHWPRSAGLPDFRSVAVRAVASPTTAVSASVAPLVARPRMRVYRVELPGAGDRVRSVLARVSETAAAFGYRVYGIGRPGVWEEVASGTSRGGRAVDVELSAVRGALRLDLYADSSDSVPRLEAVEARYAPAWVIFDALAPGRYVVRYGGHDRGPTLDAEQAAALGPAVDRPLDPVERARPLDALVRPLRAAAPLEREPDRTWPIDVSDVAVGELTRVALPTEVSKLLEGGEGDVLVVAGGRVLAHAAVDSRTPDLVEAREAEPERASGVGERSYVVADMSSMSITTQVETFADAVAGTRVSLRFDRAARPGIDRTGARFERTWSCPESGDVACRAAVERTGGFDADRLTLGGSLAVGVASTPPSVLTWRTARHWAFVRPEDGTPELAWVASSGRRGEVAPLGPVAPAVVDALALASTVRASVDVRAGEEAGEHDSRLRRIGLIFGLVVVAAGLVWVLVRNLPK